MSGSKTRTNVTAKALSSTQATASVPKQTPDTQHLQGTNNGPKFVQKQCCTQQVKQQLVI
jgi:hypothetical protein